MANDGRDKKDPSKTSSAYDVMEPRINLVNMLMAGTDALRAAGEDYLPKHSAESDANYNERKARSVLVNYFRRTVESLVGKPFSKEVVLGEDMPAPLKELAEDVDRQGNNINVFARRAFQDGLVKGLTHILVEFPNTAVEQPQTLEDEKQLGARPYFVLVPHENVLAAYSEYREGCEVLTHVRIWEEETRRDGFDEVTIQRVRVLEPGRWELWRKMARNKWEKEDEGVTTLSYIPLVTFYADREDFMVAHPPLTDLAHVNISHWQSGSDQRNVLTVARFPMLAGSGLNEEESVVKIGPRQLLTTISADGKFYYVEHSGAAIESGRLDMKDLEAQMAMLGVELLTKSGDMTATAKSIDTAENLSMLQAMILIFADTLERAFQIAAEWLSLGKDAGGSIKINTDFGLSLNDATDLTTLQAARTAKEISHETFIHELQRRGVLSEDFDMEEDQKQMTAEKQANIVDMAFTNKLQQEGVLPKPTLPQSGDQQQPPQQQPGEKKPPMMQQK